MKKDTLRLVQLKDEGDQRHVAMVKEPGLVLLRNFSSAYELAMAAVLNKKKIKELVEANLSTQTLDYAAVYNGKDKWKLLPSFDHPGGPFGCLISGTGLTHKNSALNRQMMHKDTNDKPTDSIIMYQWGVEGGSPAKGTIGVQPEWFYKGSGAALRAHGQTLEVPNFGNDGGEEPEIAAAYIVDEQGNPWRVGFTTGNEFSDHVMEKKNYLYLAPSKLRQCAIGPELVIDDDFSGFKGQVKVMRGDKVLWSSDINSGEKNMSHSLENMEYHHFKYPGHRIPGQVHIHFFGADAFSFGHGIKLEQGDTMHIEWEGMGRALVNSLKVATDKEKLLTVSGL